MGRRLDALISREGNDGKRYFTRIGAAFENQDGSWSVRLDANPLDGQIWLKEPLPRDGQGGGGGGGGGQRRQQGGGQQQRRQQGGGGRPQGQQGGGGGNRSRYQQRGASYPQPVQQTFEDQGLAPQDPEWVTEGNDDGFADEGEGG